MHSDITGWYEKPGHRDAQGDKYCQIFHKWVQQYV